MTPTETATSGIIPTPTVDSEITIVSEDDCQVQSNWLSYEVQPGDKLLFIARAVSSTIAEIRIGNCYDSISGVFAGESILLPTLPTLPISIVEPVFPPDDQIFTATGCDVENMQITAPNILESNQGIFAIIGSANAVDFDYYKIEIRPDWSDVYSLYSQSNGFVEDDLLGLVNTEIFGSGLHHLRITVVNTDDEIAENGVCEIPLIFGLP